MKKSYASHRNVADQAKCWGTSSPKRLFADERLSWSGDGGAKMIAHTLQNHQENRYSDERKMLPEHSQHDFWNTNISFSQPLLPKVVVSASYQAKELITCQE